MARLFGASPNRPHAMSEPRIEFQPARLQDVDFAFEVMEQAMRPYVEATWGAWDPEFQRRGHAASYVPGDHRIVVVNDVPAGVVATSDSHTHVQLEKLFLLPAFHRQGVGSRVLQRVLVDAAASGRPVRLRVLQANPAAQRFYLRHGFVVTERTAERVFMQRGEQPHAPIPPPA